MNSKLILIPGLKHCILSLTSSILLCRTSRKSGFIFRLTNTKNRSEIYIFADSATWHLFVNELLKQYLMSNYEYWSTINNHVLKTQFPIIKTGLFHFACGQQEERKTVRIKNGIINHKIALKVIYWCFFCKWIKKVIQHQALLRDN